MKSNHLIKSKHGFTLIELLVVISIIAILAAAGGAAAVKSLEKAKKVKALTTTKQVELAIDQFLDDTNNFPLDAADTNSDTLDILTRGTEVINHLVGLNTTINRKGTKYLTTPQAKRRKEGLFYESDTQADLYDPWGEPYRLWLDTDFDEILEEPFPTANATTTKIRGSSALIMSNGSDQEAGDLKTDVYSWK